MLGGGNADKIDKLPRKVRRGDNADAFEGGFRLWKGIQAARRTAWRMRLRGVGRASLLSRNQACSFVHLIS
jgi:hypothetical protein